MRLSWICLAAALTASGCATICDEVADEGEASGCAVGLLPDDATDDLTDCSGVREAKAQCLLDLTDNVCSRTQEEEDALQACYIAAGAQ